MTGKIDQWQWGFRKRPRAIDNLQGGIHFSFRSEEAYIGFAANSAALRLSLCLLWLMPASLSSRAQALEATPPRAEFALFDSRLPCPREALSAIDTAVSTGSPLASNGTQRRRSATHQWPQLRRTGAGHTDTESSVTPVTASCETSTLQRPVTNRHRDHQKAGGVTATRHPVTNPSHTEVPDDVAGDGGDVSDGFCGAFLACHLT